jgi:hypothetical protein
MRQKAQRACTHHMHASQEAAPGRLDRNDRASQGFPWPLRLCSFFFLSIYFY